MKRGHGKLVDSGSPRTCKKYMSMLRCRVRPKHFMTSKSSIPLGSHPRADRAGFR
jgi:hypothetical protein